ncbi:hypothetical protein MLD38_009460 [Melastoma candidum]|uniref:Uncharacterized protein n=1 Tax=Melastoma candidum TaxID=119954 RepID=A0ACB9RXT3_9MYRT|nr:hypothetical protein MLD38_009460 [Melastoma candidum]
MMRCFCCSALRDRLQPLLLDYDRLQHLAVVLIHVQIACALVGSLGALYSGVQLINLSISLFALVAIESSSQSLGRTYAVLLFLAILVDVAWFVLFARDIWNISSETYGAFFVFSVKLTLAMQIMGCFVRVSSSFVWVQIYRIGVSYVNVVASEEADFDLRSSFLSPSASGSIRQSSGSEDATGGSIYDPAYYTSLFKYAQLNSVVVPDQKNCMADDACRNCTADDDSRSAVEHCPPRPSNGGSCQATDVHVVLESAATESCDKNSMTKT